MNRIPWYVWTSLASVSCIVLGVYWDISWHMSIGRDSFWTPAHLAIQAGGIISGVSGTYLILSTTLRKRPGGIAVWGFRGPLGAFLGVWGSATMVVSAPFDNWWHSAYGLDVRILSPPHTVLTTGVLGVAVGAVLVIVATLNGATGPVRERLRMLMLVIGGEILVLAMIAILEMTFRANLHRAEPYRAVAIVAPIVLLAIARVSDHRWGATAVAAVYTGFMIVALWMFARIPAEPKLGPVYQPITHLVPLEFPLLVIAPALLFDVVGARLHAWPRYRLAIVLGAIFVVALVAVEWPFAEFLNSEPSRTWVFGTDYFPYFERPEWASARHQFLSTGPFARGIAEAVVAAMAASWLGLALGDAMRKVRR